MHETSDAQLLRDYADRGSEAAFRELVTRHTDFVYSAAVRQVDSPDLAGDIAQSVFTDLARKARPLAEKILAASSLAGWLHRSTRYAALNHLRDTRRRLANERQAMEQLLTNSESAPDWERIRPALDEALDSLADEDREAILLRYFKNHDFRVVGLALGISDDTAQKRVSRAVERLREFFAKRGVTVGASGLVVVISANAVQAAPVGLAVTISTAAALGGTTATVTIATHTTMNWLNIKSIAAIIAAALTAGTGTYMVKQSEATRLRSENQNLIGQKDKLADERDTALSARTAHNDEIERLRKNHNELLRLRGEVGVLRNELAAQKRAVREQPAPPAETSTASIHPPGSFIAKDQMRFGDFSTPEAAYESFLWAGLNGTYDQLTESISPEYGAKESAVYDREQFETDKRRKKDALLFKGMQILARKTLTEDEVHLKVLHEKYDTSPNLPPKGDIAVQPMVRIGNVWKRGGGSTQAYNEHVWAVEQPGQIQTFVP